MALFPAIGMNALADIVPSAIASLFGIQKGVNSIAYLVSPAFTVSGFFVGFYQGFKVVGVAVISAIYGALGGLIEKLRLEKPGDMSDLLFAIVIQITVLSFFDNLLMYLPNSFQIILVLVLYLFHCPSKWNWCVSKKSS